MRAPLCIALMLTAAIASAAEQTRPMPAFDGVSVEGPIYMIIHAGKTQALTLQGDDRFLKSIETKVVNGKLLISFPKNHSNDMSNDSKILISLPALRSLYVEGAGYAELNNIGGERLEIGFQGAGKLVANGNVKLLKMQAQGVGDVDTKALLAQRADVSFEGIGAVKVYASERLDAVVQGLGSLSYYGNPRVVNKTVEGMGSVKAVSR